MGPDRSTTRSMKAQKTERDPDAYSYAAIRIVELLRKPLTSSTREKDIRAVELLLREIFGTIEP